MVLANRMYAYTLLEHALQAEHAERAETCLAG